ncbi:YrhK family protein [Phycicoccus sp. MAQZ13P-2]|nr:YrhK family protein [Phycicoccus mangrovi]MBT9273155.1 YrhK family protein [Phycicoccus mangrovi]
MREEKTVELTLPWTDDELVLRNRYETLSIVNDLLIAVWFLVGSILFFRESTTYAGTWFFVVGSAQLMLRPSIRLSRRIHLRRHRQRHGGSGPTESSQDF